MPLGSPMRGRITLGQDGLLPAAILMLEDAVPRELGNRPRFLVDRTGISAGGARSSTRCSAGSAAGSAPAR